jgi:hypothetical protein
MKKELLNALKNLDTQTIIDFVESEMKEVYKETYSNPVFGWTYSIILDADGVLWSTLLSPGGRPMSVHEGDSVILGSINSQSEIESELVNLDVINNLTEEEREKFIEEFKTCYLCSDGYDEENFSIYDYLNCEYINDIEECYKDLFPDKWEELIEIYIDNEWEYYLRDGIVDEICNSRDELINIESSF